MCGSKGASGKPPVAFLRVLIVRGSAAALALQPCGQKPIHLALPSSVIAARRNAGERGSRDASERSFVTRATASRAQAFRTSAEPTGRPSASMTVTAQGPTCERGPGAEGKDFRRTLQLDRCTRGMADVAADSGR